MDTSTDVSSIALTDDSRLLGEYSFAHKMDLSRRLMVNIRSLIADCGFRMGDLQGIGVSIGPGSFTGLRISAVTAKTLAQVLDIPIAGLVSLDLLAWQFDYLRDARVCPLIKVRKGEVYHACYEMSDGSPHRLTDFRASTIPEMVAEARGVFRSSPFLVCGDGVPDVLPILQEELHDQVVVAPMRFSYPKAEMIARLASEKIASGHSDDALTLVPFYIRPSAPEMRMGCEPEKRDR